MIKMYVMKTCPYCEYVEKQVADKARANESHASSLADGREQPSLGEANPEFQIIDISEHVRNLHEFLALRDHRPEFAEAKAEGDIGIPCYVREDGSITLSSAEVGLEPMPDGYIAEGASCSLDGKGC